MIDNKKLNKNKRCYMDKKGQIEIILLGLIIAGGLIVAGVYSTSELLKEHRYIGDISKNESYDLSKCVVNIETKNLVVFNSKEEAQDGFKLRECN
jgi:hypothetical protein